MIRSLTTTSMIGAFALALAGCRETKPVETASVKQPAVEAAPVAAKHEHHDDDHSCETPPTDTTEAYRGRTPATREQVDPDGIMRRGDALSTSKAMTVDEALASAEKLSGQSVKLTGKVEAVCVAKGCWFSVRGEKPEDQVRIVNSGFFVAKSTIGKPATVEGELVVKTISPEFAQHMEDERASSRNEPRKTITAPQREVTIKAKGVEIQSGKS